MSSNNYKKKYDHIKKQFELFTYAVSHDLNAPLRHIREFTKILLSTMNNVTEEQKEAIHFINKGVLQSEAMVAGLLSYSRLSTLQKPFSIFSTKHLFTYANTALKELIKAKNAKITLPEEYPNIEGDLEQLSNMTVYIVENAIKFTDNNIRPNITIAIKEEHQNVIISVTDNGVGIKERFFKDIFGIFKQLNPESVGIGLGLTLTGKIIDRHNGKIWLESEMNKGTVFYISLPKNQGNNP